MTDYHIEVEEYGRKRRRIDVSRFTADLAAALGESTASASCRCRSLSRSARSSGDTSKADLAECERCEGLGEILVETWPIDGPDKLIDCPACDGWGKVRE